MEILWIAIAYVLGMADKEIRLPALIGFLAAGIILSLTGIEVNKYLIPEIRQLGVLLLLFTVGLHLHLKNIDRAQVFGAGG
jgi:Kef-type K+ transport system, predicted NAD-binding component